MLVAILFGFAFSQSALAQECAERGERTEGVRECCAGLMATGADPRCVPKFSTPSPTPSPTPSLVPSTAVTGNQQKPAASRKFVDCRPTRRKPIFLKTAAPKECSLSSAEVGVCVASVQCRFEDGRSSGVRTAVCRGDKGCPKDLTECANSDSFHLPTPDPNSQGIVTPDQNPNASSATNDGA